MVGIKSGTKTKLKIGIKPKDKWNLAPLISSFLEFSTEDLRAKLLPQIENNPSLVIDELDFYWERMTSEPDEEEEDSQDAYDPPEMEEDIEEGEGGADLRRLFEPTEGFIQYAHRRIEEDFDEGDIKERIKNILKNIDFNMLSMTDIPEDLRQWFENLFNEYPYGSSFGKKTVGKKADIIFYLNNSKICYEINLGFLDHIKLDKNTERIIPISFSGFEFSPDLLPYIINSRREALILMALFLIEKQESFFKAKDLNTALERLRSIDQKEVIMYLKEKYNLEKDKTWVSRVVNNKWIQAPFSDRLFPLMVFFDEHIGAINVLKKAIDLHVIRDRNPPLNATDQLVILKALCGKKTGSRTIRKTLWPRLRQIYSGKDEKWEELGISGRAGRPKVNQKISDADLSNLINRINENLDLQKNISENEIKELRKEIETIEKKGRIKS